MINKAHIKIGDVVYGSSDSVDIMYDENTNVYDKITNMSNTMAYIDIEDNENVEFEGTITGSTVELVDRLDSTSTTSALTANQGKVLKGYIDELNEDVETLNSNKADKDVVDGLSSSINELNEGLESCFQSVSDGKALIASAITDKKVPTDADATFETMANNIKDLKLGSGNATKVDVLAGKTFTNSDGVEYTGEMTNQGAKTASLNCGGSYTIPAGYHNGSGKVTANSLASQTDGTATAAQILKDKTAYVDGKKITGTMTNQGAKTASLNCGGSYTIPAGYHNGSGKVTANSLASQTKATAAAAQITKGYTAWVNGVKITGTRAAAVTSQTGSKSMTVAKLTTGQAIISFSSAFDKVPTISLALTSAYGADNYEDMTRAMTLTATSVTRTSFVLNAKNGYSNQSAICSISWAAQA